MWFTTYSAQTIHREAMKQCDRTQAIMILLDVKVEIEI